MKTLLRTYVIHLAALWMVVSLLQSSITIGTGVESFLLAGVLLAVFNLLLKPILKLLFLPVNLLTLGLFSIVINALVFYLFLKVLPEGHISSWVFPGISYLGITIKEISFNETATVVLASFLVNAVTNFLSYLSK